MFENKGLAVAEGRVVAVRCLMQPGGRLEPVAISADIIARLDSSDAGRQPLRPESAS